MLTTNKKLQITAQNKKYGVGAFNVYDMESVQSVVQAAEMERSPAIIATTEGAIEYAGHELMADIIKTLAKRSKMPLEMR